MTEPATAAPAAAATQGAVAVPLRGPGVPEARRREAYWHPDCPTSSPPPACPVEHIPPDVAAELGLAPGQALWVTQRPIYHTDDARLARTATDPDSGEWEPMGLLQVVIDETVQDSNLAIHPSKADGYRRALVADMAAPEFAWWLYSWLGAAGVADRLSGAQRRLREAKNSRGSSSPGSRGTRSRRATRR